MDEKTVTSLRIPSKTREDNFKLVDFQGDFSDLLALALSATAKPTKIAFTNMSGMEITYDDGRVVTYKFERRGEQITKIINMNSGQETIITW